MHLKAPATCQPDQGFPWFSSFLEQMVNWYPESHVALNVSLAAIPNTA
jgi:hypothetical protein